ncbi:MAG: hypothetical protein ABSH35_04340 [Isosphaeraceae bacterium]|jgi:hypothetical protein
MPAAIQRGQWQHLHHKAGSSVLITDKDGDRFVLPVQDAIRACRDAEKLEAFAEQFQSLMQQLHQWILARSEEIDRAYLSLDADGVIFAVVRKGKEFDPTFEDTLSDLDLNISNDDALNMIRIRVIALPYSPDETVDSFLDLSRAWVARIS